MMTAGEMFYLIQQHLGRQDISRDVFNRLLCVVLPALFRKYNFYSLAKHTYLQPTNHWSVPVPDDYYDNISLIVIAKDTRTAYVPLSHLLSVNDFIALYSTSDLEYLSQIYSPTIPMYYIIATPSDIFKNIGDRIPLEEQDRKSILLYPPIDNSLYQLSFLYYPLGVVTPNQITDDYEHPLMQKYGEWVMYEMLWRIAVQLKEFDTATAIKNLADEKFIEARLSEAREANTPPLTLHLQRYAQRVRITEGPKAEEVGRIVIKVSDV
jgi:hypothetical protein